MLTVHKFPLPLTDSYTLPIQHPAQIIHTGLDPIGSLCIWAVVDPTSTEWIQHTLHVIGTGNPMSDDPKIHLGSVLQEPFMWHVFRDITPQDLGQ